MLACPHNDCKTKSTFYKNLQQHYHSCHKDNLNSEAAKKHTYTVKARIVQEKVILSSCNVIGGELFHVSFGGDTLQLRGLDEYSVALSVACILLAGNKLRGFSVLPRQEITIGSLQNTIVYHAWAKFEKEKYEPEIKRVQAIVKTHSLCEDAQFIFQTNNSNIDTLSEEVNYFNLEEIALDIPTNITVLFAKDLLPFLQKFYGYTSFKSKQEEVIDLILQNFNIFVNMPTGGGKTITYVLPTIVRPGLTIVITPLLSLINDQIKSLSQKGIPAAQYTGSTSSAAKQSVLFALKQPVCPVKLLYVTPEMLTKDVTLTNALQSLYSRNELQMFVYDEGHCISAWGHDFRTSYVDCSVVKKSFPSCPALILSASATMSVQVDVCEILGIDEVKQVTDTFNRTNLFYDVKSKTRETVQVIADLIKDLECSLIFCATRGETETVNAQLRAKGIKCASFHAGLSSQLKSKQTEEWMNGSLQSLCCTSAFGMGIDKANVRAVVHYSMPHSIEEYFQESGRGGRDGLPCICIHFFSAGDQINILRGIYSRTGDDPSLCTKKLLSFQHVMNYDLNLNLCRRKILVGFFSKEDVICNLGCDICKEDKSSVQCFDTTSITKSIIECIQSIRTSSTGFFKLQQFVEVITGKKTKNVLKNNHHRVAQYGILKCNKKKAEHFLRHLVCLDILRELPVDIQNQHSGFYLGLGSTFLDVLSGQMQTFYHEKL